MIGRVLFGLGILCSNWVFAQSNPELISHRIILQGLSPKEGRFVRVDIIENSRFKSGYYFCANQLAYTQDYYVRQNQTPFHIDHLIQVSMCQDETLTQCQDIGTDHYITSRNNEGNLENDVEGVSYDVTILKEAFQACDPDDSKMNELMKQSLHLNDRRFSQTG